MYYDGMSVKDIKGLLKQEYHNDPSKKTIYQWVDKYSDIAIKKAKDYHPKVSDTWIADETVLRIGGQNVWMYDIIDDDTRFLLATRIALSRTTHDATMLMKEAQKKAGKTPKVVITDKNSSYLVLTASSLRLGAMLNTFKADHSSPILIAHRRLNVGTRR
jgi:transposase-like protein